MGAKKERVGTFVRQKTGPFAPNGGSGHSATYHRLSPYPFPPVRKSGRQNYERERRAEN